ncbi:MAG TPA: extracellular solute-binding protein [Candidatus Limnocylindrales bacterium]|nr:extracellular solute-binding protein [Candidatus Limnocylindrales bacterium]
MNTKLRVLSTLGALAIVVGACSSGATPTPAGSTGTGASQPAPSTAGGSTAPATGLKGALTVWASYGSGAGTEPTAFKTLTDKISAANPDLKLTIQDIKFDDLFKKFELEAASGGGPDLFIAPNDSLGKEARAGLFLDITTMLDGKLGNDSDVSVAGSKVDGKLYMVPESLKAVAMYYDKSKIATPPATTDALLAGVKDGSIKAGFDAHSSYHSFGWWAGFGGKLMDDSGKCVADTTGVADAYKYFQDLQTAGAKWYEKYDDLASDFKSGKIDLIVDGPWASGGYKDALKDNLAVAPMPAGPKGPSAPLTGVDGWYINTNAKDSALAVNFALEMVKTENEQVFVDTAGHIPADKTIKITDPITQKFAEAVATGFARPQVQQLDNFWGNFDNALNLVIQKHEDPTKAATDACKAMNTANKIP